MPHTISSFKPFAITDADLRIIGCARAEINDLLQKIGNDDLQYVENAGARLNELDWLAGKIDADVKASNSPFFSEGLFALQLYLLVTCADTLGHIDNNGGSTKRIRTFFLCLPEQDQQDLVSAFRVWKTTQSEALALSLIDKNFRNLRRPSKSEIIRTVEAYSVDERLERAVNFLCDYRNWFTHESDYPKLGMHPILKVLNAKRLKVSTAGSLGEIDHTQIMIVNKEKWYVVYYDTDDPIGTLRTSIVRGLGRIIRGNR